MNSIIFKQIFGHSTERLELLEFDIELDFLDLDIIELKDLKYLLGHSKKQDQKRRYKMMYNCYFRVKHINFLETFGSVINLNIVIHIFGHSTVQLELHDLHDLHELLDLRGIIKHSKKIPKNIPRRYMICVIVVFCAKTFRGN
jgi:hypothetical protein